MDIIFADIDLVYELGKFVGIRFHFFKKEDKKPISVDAYRFEKSLFIWDILNPNNPNLKENDEKKLCQQFLWDSDKTTVFFRFKGDIEVSPGTYMIIKVGEGITPEGESKILDKKGSWYTFEPCMWIIRPYAELNRVIPCSKEGGIILGYFYSIAAYKGAPRQEAMQHLVSFCRKREDVKRLLDLLIDRGPIEYMGIYPALADLLLSVVDTHLIDIMEILEPYIYSSIKRRQIFAIRLLGYLKLREAREILLRIYFDKNVNNVPIGEEDALESRLFSGSKEKRITSLMEEVREAIKVTEKRWILSFEGRILKEGSISSLDAEHFLEVSKNIIKSVSIDNELERLIFEYGKKITNPLSLILSKRFFNEVKEKLKEKGYSFSVRTLKSFVYHYVKLVLNSCDPLLVLKLTPDMLATHFNLRKNPEELFSSTLSYLEKQRKIKEKKEGLREIVYLFDKYHFDLITTLFTGKEKEIKSFYELNWKPSFLVDFPAITSRLLTIYSLDNFLEGVKKGVFEPKEFDNERKRLLKICGLTRKDWGKIPYEELYKAAKYFMTKKLFCFRKSRGNTLEVINLGPKYSLKFEGFFTKHDSNEGEINILDVPFDLIHIQTSLFHSIRIFKKNSMVGLIEWRITHKNKVLIEKFGILYGHRFLRMEYNIFLVLIHLALKHIIFAENIPPKKLFFEKVLEEEWADPAEAQILSRFGFTTNSSKKELLSLLNQNQAKIEIGYGGPLMDLPYLKIFKERSKKIAFKIFFLYKDGTVNYAPGVYEELATPEKIASMVKRGRAYISGRYEIKPGHSLWLKRFLKEN
ncbi:MAG: hypothetical protein DRG20_00170 [Deltaproteobacteria bacterium]|nr:MAG: hypothetical protein DRG20_00170 [Deltaproteobacteria bacterium]